MTEFLLLLPSLLALFLVFLFKRQTDFRIQALEEELAGKDELTAKIKRIETRLAQQAESNEILQKKLEQEIKKNTTSIQKHQSFMENITAVSNREIEPKKSSALLEMIAGSKSSLDIAREFGIPVGEVDLMKNLHNFKNQNDAV